MTRPTPRPTTAAAALIVVLLILSGCASLDQIVKPPTATFSGFHMADATLLDGTAVFQFNVHNPNPIGIRASRITYDLKLNGLDFVSGRLNQGVSLAAKATSPMRIPVKLNYLDVVDSLTQLWQTRQAAYALSGGFAVGPFTIPFTAEGVFDLPRLPEIKLASIQVKQLSLTGAALTCALTVSNPNGFNLLLKRLDYTLKLDGTALAAASATPGGPIRAEQRSKMALDLNISFSQLGRSAYQLFLGSGARYALDGEMVFNAPGGAERSVPFDLSGQVPFLR